MSKRIRYKSRQQVRIKLRTVLLVSTVVFGFSVAALFAVLNFLESEPSHAASDPMVVSHIDVFQDTLPVLKGTSSQVVLGICIHTKGKAQHLNFSGMELAARGTSKPVENYVTNARLWTTGNKNFFIPVQQISATLPTLTDENFRLDGKQPLNEGANFFWVTFDVQKTAGSRPVQIDAECISVQIGTLLHEPDIAAPQGAKRILNNIPYYSTGSGDISSLNSWNSSRDGSGKRPSDFNLSTATYHIQSGHIMRNDLNACLPYLVIERNGVLLSVTGMKSERLVIHGGGTMVQERLISNPASIEVFQIYNGGNYIHRNKGYLPGKNRRFDIHSNIVLNDYSAATFAEAVAWGNVIIDAKTAQSTDFMNGMKTINGNMEIRCTGENGFLYTSSDDTITIAGDLLINGGRLAFANSKNAVLNVAKNFELKSGTLCDALPGKLSKGSLEFFPGTRVHLKAGQLSMSGKHSAIKFREEFTSWKQDSTMNLLPDITIMPGCTLKLLGSSMGELAANKNFFVSSTALLDCGTSIIYGKGNFQLEPYATLITALAEGINSSGDIGSIQTRSRYFSSGAGYIFAGKCSPQSTGIFTTSPIANTVNQITLRKTDPRCVLILQQDIHVTGRLVKERGNINRNSFKLETAGETAATTAR